MKKLFFLMVAIALFAVKGFAQEQTAEVVATENDIEAIAEDNSSFIADNKEFDPDIARIEPCYRENRPGDIPHSQASIIKAQRVLGYQPKYDALSGFEQACEWYWNNLK